MEALKLIEPTGYWTFFSNPKKWAIDEKLSSDDIYDYYTISDYHKNFVHKGHLGLLRVGHDMRTKRQLKGKVKLKRGVYSIVEILTEPKLMVPPNDDYLIGDKLKKRRYRVKIKFIKNLLDNPLLIDGVEIENIYYDKFLVEGFQGSTMPLNRRTFLDVIKFRGGIDNLDFSIRKLNENNFNDLLRIKDLEDKNIDAVPEVKEVLSKRIERGIIAQKIKELNNFECQICKNLGKDPLVFKKANGEYYIETHHIISVSKQIEGSLSTNNLLTVCPNHHRQLHYGQVNILENNQENFKLSIDNKEITIKKMV